MDQGTETVQMATVSDHMRILQNRYQHLLSRLTDLDDVAEKLQLRCLLTQSERTEMGKLQSRQYKQNYLCNSLTNMGIAKLVDISHILKGEQAMQARSAGLATSGMAVAKAGAVESKKTENTSSERVDLGDPRGMNMLPGSRPQQGSSHEKQLVSSASSRGPTMADSCVTEDIFAFLFYNFTAQLLPQLTPTSSLSSASPLRAGSNSNDNLSKVAPIKAPLWLQVDVTPESVREYFSARVLKDVCLSECRPASMRLSLLLDSFRKLYHEFQTLMTNNQSLYERFDEVTERNKILEAELSRFEGDRHHHRDANPRSDLTTDKLMLEKMRYLESTVAEVEAVKRSYARSEQRCKQLVVLTQQWSIECDEKVRLICLQDEELKELTGQVAALERRVDKYKKFWMENKDEPVASEVALRRELYDPRDAALKQVAALSAELETLKVNNTQLADIVVDFTFQADVKEDSEKEVLSLLEQNRELKQKVDHMTKDKVEQTDKIFALELLVKDLGGKAQDYKPLPISPASRPQVNHQQQLPGQPQALVTGRNPLPTVCRNPFNFDPSYSHCHRHQQQPPPLQDAQISPLNSNYHRNEDDDNSLASSNGDFASLSAHPTAPNRSILTNYSERLNRSHIDQPGSASASEWERGENPMLRSRDLDEAPPSESSDYTLGIRYPNFTEVLIAPLLEEEIKTDEKDKEESFFEISSQEHPSRELLDLPGYQGGGDFGAEWGVDIAGSKPPAYFDQSVLDPCGVHEPSKGSQDATPPDYEDLPFRKCLVCSHVFHTLSEAEFQDHVAVCFK